MKDLLLIVNPLSGGKDKKRLLRTVERHLHRPYSVVFTEYPGHGAELARQAAQDVVVAVGGDGTVSEVAGALAGTEKTLGIIPCGSGNGLALHLGISLRPRKAVEVLNQGREILMDSGLVDGKPFFCTAGMGLDADVAWDFARSRRRGLGSYIALAWKRWQHFTPAEYTLTVDGKVHRRKAVMVTVANANQWGNQARIADLASVQDGLLDAVVVHPFRTWEIPLLAGKLLTGYAHTSRRVETFRGGEIRLERPSAGPLHRDGDPCEGGTRAVFQAMPGTLRVLVPAKKFF